MGCENVCQICGASGYRELLFYCINCKTFAAHKYCLGKALCRDEEVNWLCDPCNNKPLDIRLEKSAKMLNANKSQKNRITTSKALQEPQDDVICKHGLNKEALACSAVNKSNIDYTQVSSPRRDSSHSGAMKSEGQILKKRRKLIVLEDDELDEIVCANKVADKILQVKKPIDMSNEVCHGKKLKRPIRRLSLQDENHLDEEVHVKQASQFSPIGGSSQIQALTEVGKCSPRRSNWSIDHQPSKVSAQPIVRNIWRGFFNVCCKELGPFEAHLSSKACKKVWNIASRLPQILQISKLPRLDSWPKSFKTSPPNDESIALYFFAQDARAEATLDKLLDDVTRNDLTLKVMLAEAELLTFSSTILPEGCQKFQGKCYLWGLFRRRQDLGSCALADICPKPNESITKIQGTAEFKHPTERDLDNTAQHGTTVFVDNTCSKKGQFKSLDENACDVTEAANVNLSMQRCLVEDCSSPNEIPEKGEWPSDFKHCFTDKQLIDNSVDTAEGKIKCHDGNACFETQVDLKHAEEENYVDMAENCTIVEKQLMDKQAHYGFGFEDVEVSEQQLSLFPEKIEDIAITSRLGGSNAIDLELGLGQSHHDQNMHPKCMTGSDSAGNFFLGNVIFF